MPILDNIKIAENEAEKIRLEAKSEAEKIIETAKVSGNKKAMAILDDAKATLAKNNHEYLEKINQLESEIKNKVANELEELERLANQNHDVAINFIVKQVFTV